MLYRFIWVLGDDSLNFSFFLSQGRVRFFRKIWPLFGSKIDNFEGFGSQDPYGSIEHVKISIPTKSQPPTPKLRPKNAPNTLSISVNLTRPLHEPFKIKDLGLLTHIFRESATRRFLWCNSQLLTPSGRRDMSQTMFLPTGRIWLEPFEIILNKTW